MPKITKQKTSDSQDSGVAGLSDDEQEVEGPTDNLTKDDEFSGSEYCPEDNSDDSCCSDDDGDILDCEDLSGNSNRIEDIYSDNEDDKDQNDPEVIDDEDHESEREDGLQEDDGQIDDPKIFKARDGTIWTSEVPPTTRTLAENLSRLDPGPLGDASAKGMTEIDVFRLFFDQAMIEEIVTWTNEQAMEVVEASNKSLQEDDPKRTWKPVDLVEMEAFIGLILLAGVDRCKNQDADEFWSIDSRSCKPAFIATMSRERFLNLRRHLRFRSRADRRKQMQDKHLGKNTSKLGPIEKLFESFNENLEKYFEPGVYLTVDEMLVRFFGKAPFRVYMKSKPGKYGIKIWMIVDAETRYILKIQVYQGKMGGVTEKDQGKRVVLELAEPYLDAARGITADNFFTSKELALELLQRKTTYVGTIRHNKREVPKRLVDLKGREDLSSAFLFCGKLTLVSYVPRKNKNVLLLSSEHHSATTQESDARKPEIILNYNSTKGGVDTVDQMVKTYSCQRASCRWPMKLFYTMLDMAALNSWIIWKWNDMATRRNRKVKRRHFIRQLCFQLIQPNIERRATGTGLKKYIVNAIGFMGIEIPKAAPSPIRLIAEPNYLRNRGDCRICRNELGKRRQPQTHCDICRHFVCSTHRSVVCTSCIVIERDCKTEMPIQVDGDDTLECPSPKGEEMSADAPPMPVVVDPSNEHHALVRKATEPKVPATKVKEAASISNVSTNASGTRKSPRTQPSYENRTSQKSAKKTSKKKKKKRLKVVPSSLEAKATANNTGVEVKDDWSSTLCMGDQEMPQLEPMPMGRTYYQSYAFAVNDTGRMWNRSGGPQGPCPYPGALVPFRQEPDATPKSDEFDLFCLSVAPKLRRLSELSKRKATEVQMKIQGILLEHEPD